MPIPTTHETTIIFGDTIRPEAHMHPLWHHLRVAAVQSAFRDDPKATDNQTTALDETDLIQATTEAG